MKRGIAIEMDKQQVKNGVIVRNGRLSVYMPKPRFSGGEVKWYPDKIKEVVRHE